jgi:hypothetical protein
LDFAAARKRNIFSGPVGQEKIIFFLGAQPGGKNFLQTNRVFFAKSVHKTYSWSTRTQYII